jgi:peptidoglycan/xylan/chitin deacetylase (PgdA/CDA1 family)
MLKYISNLIISFETMDKKRLTVLAAVIIGIIVLSGIFFMQSRSNLKSALSRASETAHGVDSQTGSLPAGASETASTSAAPLGASNASVTPAVLPAQGPIISFNFDDGFLSAYNIARPILDAAGYKGTFYIITGYFGKPAYVSKDQVLSLQADGQEIGAHTRHHPQLATITDEAQLQSEILGSKQDLLAMGIKDVSTFAFPEGSFSPQAEQVVKDSGFLGARTTNPLLNDKNTDHYLLLRQRVEADTPWSDVKAAIDQATAQKKWLIIVFHRIDENGSVQSTRHEMLQQIVDYVKQKNIPVVTNEQGLKIIGNID